MASDGVKRPRSELPEDVLTLNVGGRLFTTRRSTLCMHAGALKRMFDPERRFEVGVTEDENGRPFVDRDGDAFACVMSFLRCGMALAPPTSTIIVCERELEYYFDTPPPVCTATSIALKHNAFLFDFFNVFVDIFVNVFALKETVFREIYGRQLRFGYEEFKANAVVRCNIVCDDLQKYSTITTPLGVVCTQLQSIVDDESGVVRVLNEFDPSISWTYALSKPLKSSDEDVQLAPAMLFLAVKSRT